MDKQLLNHLPRSILIQVETCMGYFKLVKLDRPFGVTFAERLGYCACGNYIN